MSQSAFINNILFECRTILESYFGANPNDSCAYVKFCIDGKEISGCMVNQRVAYPPGNTSGWQEIPMPLVKIEYSHLGKTIHIVLTANHESIDTINDTIIADAIKIVNTTTGSEKIIDNNDFPSFYTEQSISRHFLSMVDDGGPSKSLFFLLQACYISSYHVEDCLGLMYGMCHNSLISFGATCSDYPEKPPFVNAIKEGKTFGEACLSQSQSEFYGRSYALIGAGTLKAKANLPYYNIGYLTITNTDIQVNKLWFARYGASISNNVTVRNGSSLKIISGRDIIITPEFLADYGSMLDLSIDKSLDY